MFVCKLGFIYIVTQVLWFLSNQQKQWCDWCDWCDETQRETLIYTVHMGCVLEQELFTF